MKILDDTIATLQNSIRDAKAVPAVAALITQRADLLKQIQSLTQKINTALGPDVLEAEQTLEQLSRQQNRQNRQGQGHPNRPQQPNRPIHPSPPVKPSV